VTAIEHLKRDQLEAGLDEIRCSPKDGGSVEMIVRRPETEAREVLSVGELHVEQGLIGDNWLTRGCRKTDDGAAHPQMQINIMNSRVIALVAGDRDRWALAGDQIFLDLDLSKENLPAGTRLALGDAVIQVSAEPHTGCKKFVARFGADAMVFVNSGIGKQLCLRGINARVIQAGRFSVGDKARKIT
jgi:hypothetical protein